VAVSGYSNTNGSGSTISGYKIELQPLNTNTIWYSGGWGINNLDGTCSACSTGDAGDLASTAPEHAIDNQQRNDMALLTFTQAVQLTGVKLGYADTDSDISVLAYTGAGNPTTNGKLAGLTYGELATNGWTVIGNYLNLGTVNTKAVNASNTVSSYWLIGAFNTLATGGTMDSSYDYVKLTQVTGLIPTRPPTVVSEPGSAALFAAALVGMVALRRRQNG
jgi:hypothetical protein